MIFIVLAALFWGITNPFLQNGAEGEVYNFFGSIEIKFDNFAQKAILRRVGRILTHLM